MANHRQINLLDKNDCSKGKTQPRNKPSKGQRGHKEKEHWQTDKPKPECGRRGGRLQISNVQLSNRSAIIAIKLNTTAHVLQNKTFRCKHTSRWKQWPRGIWLRWESFLRNIDCRTLFWHKWLHKWNWQHPVRIRPYQSIIWNAANPQVHHTDSMQNRRRCRDECNLQVRLWESGNIPQKKATWSTIV